MKNTKESLYQILQDMNLGIAMLNVCIEALEGKNYIPDIAKKDLITQYVSNVLECTVLPHYIKLAEEIDGLEQQIESEVVL